MKRRKASWWQYAILTIILVSIFILSSQSGQDSRSLSDHFITVYKQVVEKLPFLEPSVQSLLLTKSWHYVRKAAHILVYMLLGGVMASIFARSRLHALARIIFSLLCCSLYAITDEWHQYYVAGRGAQFSDVIIDSCGALVGILVMKILIELIRIIKNISRNSRKRQNNIRK